MELWTSRIFTTNHTLRNIAKKYRQINFIIDHVSLYKISILWIFSHKVFYKFSEKSSLKTKSLAFIHVMKFFFTGGNWPLSPPLLVIYIYISIFDFYSRMIILSLRKLISEFHHIRQKYEQLEKNTWKRDARQINQIFAYFASCFLSNKFQWNKWKDN